VGLVGRNQIDEKEHRHQNRDAEESEDKADKQGVILVQEGAGRRNLTAALGRVQSSRSHSCRWRALERGLMKIVELKTRTGQALEALVEHCALTDGGLIKGMQSVKVVGMTR
jgi:ATP:corrinoid adenosyltransferase